MRPVRLYMEGGRVMCAFNLHVDTRTGASGKMKVLMAQGLERMAGEYEVDGAGVEVGVKVTFAERFSLGAVNVKVLDRLPVIRNRLSPRINVSRAYLYAGRKGILKAVRFLWKKPDVYINLSGRDISDPRGRAAVLSVIQHEFGHVLGFADKYRYRNKKFFRRDPFVRDEDIMYRVGSAQKFMDYHIKRLRSCAERGRLPLRMV